MTNIRGLILIDLFRIYKSFYISIIFNRKPLNDGLLTMNFYQDISQYLIQG